MTIYTAHPIKSTHHEMMFCKAYRVRASRVVLRRLCGLSIRRFGVVELLRNNANITRPSWDIHYTFSTLTLAIIKRSI